MTSVHGEQWSSVSVPSDGERAMIRASWTKCPLTCELDEVSTLTRRLHIKQTKGKALVARRMLGAVQNRNSVCTL